MAIEIPYDLINKVQFSIRKNVGLSAYIPEDLPLRTMPSLEESLSEIDPSPMHLRCQFCKGRLLRGTDSIICVFCGRRANTDRHCDSIKFMATHGCRWFLEHLGLDGSEMVTVPVDGSESDSMKKVQVELPISELLDFEIQWAQEPEKSNTEEGNLSLFESVQPSSASLISSKDDSNGGSNSGWEANFQLDEHLIHDSEPKLSHPPEDEPHKVASSSAIDRRRTSGFDDAIDEEDDDSSCIQGTPNNLQCSTNTQAFIHHASISHSDLNIVVGEQIGEDETEKNPARTKIDGGADLLVYKPRRDEEEEGEGRENEGDRNAVRSKIDGEVDLLMSQMHDLSFMLATNLSLPQDQPSPSSKSFA